MNKYRDEIIPEYPDGLTAEEWWESNNVKLSEAFKNDPCAVRVYNALNDNHDVWRMLTGFTGTNPTGKLSLGLAYLPTYRAGQTINNPNTNEIQINLNYRLFTTSSFISMVQSLLHEYVHAEMFDKLNTSNGDFGQLFDEYADATVGSTQHNIMINKYLILMGNILSDLDGNTFDMEYYKSLAYLGLENTEYYVNNIEGTVEEGIIISFREQLLNNRTPCKN